MENLDLGTIISIAFAGLTTLFGGVWLKTKGKIKQVLSLVKEIYEAAEKLENALSDDKLTKKEIEEIKKEFTDVKDEFKALIGK